MFTFNNIKYYYITKTTETKIFLFTWKISQLHKKQPYTIEESYLQIVYPGMWQCVVGRWLRRSMLTRKRGASACGGERGARTTPHYRSPSVSSVISRAPRWRSHADVTLITICAMTLSRAPNLKVTAICTVR